MPRPAPGTDAPDRPRPAAADFAAPPAPLMAPAGLADATVRATRARTVRWVALASIVGTLLLNAAPHPRQQVSQPGGGIVAGIAVPAVPAVGETVAPPPPPAVVPTVEVAEVRRHGVPFTVYRSQVGPTRWSRHVSWSAVAGNTLAAVVLALGLHAWSTRRRRASPGGR